MIQNWKTAFFLICFLFPLLTGTVFAQDEIPITWRQNIELKHEYRHFKLNLDRYADQFFARYEKTGSEMSDTDNVPFTQNALFCSDEESGISQEQKQLYWDINMDALRTFLKDDLAPKINTDPTPVTISKDEEGNVVFDGVGRFGEKLNIEKTALLIANAAKNGIDKVTLAVDKTDPEVTVIDPELKEQGIQDLLAVGWSDFSGSPANRRHNIAVGSGKLNGTIAPQGEEFSFNEHLGRIDATTGYLKELVIVGPTTVPEYGGGLCQVSSTFYRGAMLAGLDITQRRNHSYDVRYYYPIGTDCTVYPPAVDCKFMNNTNGAVLLQTNIEGDSLFFRYYGTKDERKVYALGPYTSGYIAPPAPKYTTSTNLAPGETEQLSGIHAGINATWFRLVEGIQEPKDENQSSEDTEAPDTPKEATPQWETYFSRYQPRGLWIVTGAAQTPAPSADGSWITD